MAGPSYTHSQLRELWVLAGGTDATADTAAAIAQAESGGCQYAKHGPKDDRPVKACVFTFSTLENSYGLWQVNRNAHPQYSAASLYTELGNAKAAVEISSGGTNFQPWTTYVNGAYKRFLQAGGTPTAQPGQTAEPVVGAVTPRITDGWQAFSLSLARDLPTGIRRAHAVRAAAVAKIKARSRVTPHGR